MSPDKRLQAIRSAISTCTDDVGKPVVLIGVSKTKSADEVRPLLDAGQRRFGENRVQEAAAKWPALRTSFPDLELHLIGPLQTNKVRQAFGLFDVIHTLDRPKLARAFAEEIQRAGRQPRLLVQVNTGGEPQKAGVLPREADEFLTACRSQFGLELDGLMCIPPADEQAAPHFALLSEIARRNGLRELSMGMSADFQIAIKMGATMVRIGSALFGPRA